MSKTYENDNIIYIVSIIKVSLDNEEVTLVLLNKC